MSTIYSDTLSYYIWHLNDKLKRAKVYASWRNTLTDLSDSASNSAASSQDLFFKFDSLRHSQQYFSYVGTGLPGLNQY